MSYPCSKLKLLWVVSDVEGVVSVVEDPRCCRGSSVVLCVLLAVYCSTPVCCAVAVCSVRCGSRCSCGSGVVVGARGGTGVVVGSSPLPQDVSREVAAVGVTWGHRRAHSCRPRG